MKGVIAECMARLVTDKKGKSVWEAVLQEAGLDANATFLPTDDVPDEQVVRLADATSRVLGITREQTAEAFGEYWINQYAQKIYRIYFGRFENSREFLKGMDDLHDKVTRNVPNARPPRFEYEGCNFRSTYPGMGFGVVPELPRRFSRSDPICRI
jgi:hypothetical protein